MASLNTLSTISSFPASTYFKLLVVALSFYWVAWIIYARWFHPLRHIPGPFFASISRIWIVKHLLAGDSDNLQRRLHEKYGPLLRIAPNEVACASPDAIKIIYPIKSPNIKTDFYPTWNNPVLNKFNDHFSQTDEKLHGQRRRIVNNVYSLSNILQSEEYIDRCSQLFTKRMAEYAKEKQVVDLGDWLQMYAFDVIGELFFGKMFGFMEKREDHESYIARLDILVPFVTLMSTIPTYLRGLLSTSALFVPQVKEALLALESVTIAALECVKGRQAALDNPELAPTIRRDILQQMFEIHQKKGQEVDFTPSDISQEAYSALFAGSDTTAIAMRAVFYYLMTNPGAYAETVKEIDEAVARNHVASFGPVSYAQAIKLPYLCAVIKEAMRLHPSVGLTMPRHAPPEGLLIGDQHIPGGYRVGMNPAVVQRDKSVYGIDANSFRPRRWLEGDSTIMDRSMIQFGAGTRTCIGKNISLSEIHKLIPQVLRDFTVKLATQKPWTTYDLWFNKQTGILVTLTAREPSNVGFKS